MSREDFGVSKRSLRVILVCICWVYGGFRKIFGGLGQGLGDFRLIRSRSRHDFGMYMQGLWGVLGMSKRCLR
jgi:hypothetical protein